MRFGKTISLAASAAACFAFVLASSTPAQAIVDGTEAAHLNGAVQLWGDNERGPNQFFCTGSLIRSDVVLTAKHCLQTRGGTTLFVPSQVTVRAGSRTLGEGELRRAVHFELAGWDQAIVKLESGFANAPVNKIPPAGVTIGVNVTVAATGWGQTAIENGTVSPRLKVCTLKMTQNRGRGLVAVRVDGIPHNGDSGGPLMHNGIQFGSLVSTDNATHTEAHYISIGHEDIRRWISRKAGV